MIDQYKNLFIVKQDMFYFAFKDGQMQKVAFNETDVPPSLHNLFAASPMLYGRLDRIASHVHQVCAMLEPVLALAQSPQEKQLFENIHTFLAYVKQDCLEGMSAAELGPHKVATNKET